MICIYPVRRESLIRLVLTQTLRAAGLESEAAQRLSAARDWLHALAKRIHDAQLRHKFLTGVAENVDLLRLADSPSPSHAD